MARKGIGLIVLFIFMVSLSGCASVQKQKDQQIQGLRNQLSVLEAQLRSRDEEINSLRESLNKAQEEKEILLKQVTRKKIIPEVKSRPNIRQIQIALRNAGYNPGLIDGKMGKQTKDAIRAFQRANNLAVDGKVGKETWALLKEYLYKKVK